MLASTGTSSLASLRIELPSVSILLGSPLCTWPELYAWSWEQRTGGGSTDEYLPSLHTPLVSQTISFSLWSWVHLGLLPSSHKESSKRGRFECLTDSLELFGGMGGRVGRSMTNYHHGFGVKIHASSIIRRKPSCLLASIKGKMFNQASIKSFLNTPWCEWGPYESCLLCRPSWELACSDKKLPSAPESMRGWDKQYYDWIQWKN